MLGLISLGGVIHAQDHAKQSAVEAAAKPAIDAFAATARSFTDNDKDGFDDPWHRAFALVTEEPLQPGADPDGDGKSNREEMDLFQDPLTWPNYQLEGAADSKLSVTRREQYILSMSVSSIHSAGKDTTIAGEAIKIQSEAQELSLAYRDWQAARRDAARKKVRSSALEPAGNPKNADAGKRNIAVKEPVGLDARGRPLFYNTFDTNTNAQTLVDQLQPGGSLGLSLTGSPLGLVETDRSVDIWDEGRARETHQDLQGGGGTRIFNLDGSTVSKHSTEMAGIIGGLGLSDDGVGNFSIGAATNAKLTMSNYGNDYSEMFGRPLGASRVSNHSYGQSMGWNAKGLAQYPFPVLAWLGDIGVSTTEDFDFGRYSADSQAADQVALYKPWTLQVRAAGNDRNPYESSAGWTALGAQTVSFDGQTGLYYTLRFGVEGLYNGSRFYPLPERPGVFLAISGTPQDDGAAAFDTLPPTSTGKNMLTVGAVDSFGALADLSAFGPTDDGRLKPEIVAPGVGVFTASSSSDTGTDTSTGTSAAAATVTGTLALLNEHQENLWGPEQPLAASSAKALLVHTAQNMGANGPNYDSGYGSMQAAEAATTIESNYYAENTDANGKLIKLHTFIKELFLPESEWIYVDLGSDLATTRIEINWHADYASGYIIEGFTNALPNNPITLAKGYGSVGGIETHSWAPISLRYIRMIALTRARPSGVSINEFTVKNGSTVLSVGKPAFSSSSVGSLNLAAKAVDGVLTTRWASIYAGSTEYPWIQVDLGSAVSLNKAVITWDTNYASEYLLEGSANVSGPFTQIGVTNGSTGATSTVTFSAVNYRYVRLIAQRLANPSGVSIKELQIFNGASLLSSGRPAIANSRTEASFDASLVTDGNLTTTRWQSATPGLPGSRFALKAVGGPIRATAVWADPVGPASPLTLDSAQPAMVNGMDLRIFRNATSGVRAETKPWVLNPASPASAATRGDNFRDNLEQVETSSAVSNSAYTLELRPKMNRRVIGRQIVSLTLSGVQQIPVPIFQGLATMPFFDTPNNQVIVTETWTSVPGEIYRVEWSTNLSTWTAFRGYVPALSDVTSAAFTLSPAPPRLFLRYIPVPPNPFNVP